jgi:ABC-type bacteriocin/lantibiotic exporter with double-glycine peptidase domain
MLQAVAQVLSKASATTPSAAFASVLTALAVTSILGFSACSLGNRSFAVNDLRDDARILLVPLAHVSQQSYWDCGIGALAMVYNYWGDRISYDQLMGDLSGNADNLRGITAEDMRAHARGRGYRAFILRTDVNDLREQIEKGRPVIVCQNVLLSLNHYQVVFGYDRTSGDLLVDDPAKGPVRRSARAFQREHDGTGGFALLIVPKANNTVAQASFQRSR